MIEIRNRITGRTLPFRTVTDALRWMRDAELGAAVDITPKRHPDDPRLVEDWLEILAARLRDALAPRWRSIQMDRLAGRRIAALPGNPAAGLAIASAVACEAILTGAGARGWKAEAGFYHDPPASPMPSRTASRTPVPHGWLRHASGPILDVTGLIFDRTPVAVLVPSDDRYLSFRPSPAETRPAVRRIAEAWAAQLAPPDRDRIAEACAALRGLLPEAEPAGPAAPARPRLAALLAAAGDPGRPRPSGRDARCQDWQPTPSPANA